MKSTRSPAYLASAAAFACLWSLPAAAQRPRPRVVEVPCCRCVDGSSQTIDISTGSAPWSFAPAGGILSPAPIISPANAAWTTALAPAKWVGPGGSALAGNYTYELVIKLPRCIIPAQVTISARVAADNSERVLVDGLQVAQYTGDFGFLTQNIVGFNSPPPPLGPGTHAIQVIVNNESRASGVVLNGLIRIACPKESAGSLSVDPATGWSGRRAQPSKGRPKS